MTDRELALLEKLLGNQKDLISVMASGHSTEETEVLRAIAEAQYNITEILMPSGLVSIGPADDGPQTLQ